MRETDRSNAGVVGKHEAAHAVIRLHVWRSAGERDLDRCGPPRDEVCELAFPDTEQRLVDLISGGQ